MKTRVVRSVVFAAAAACATACADKPEPQLFDEYQSETVQMTAADGTILEGSLHIKDTTAPVVILFHQLGSNRNEWQDLRLAVQELITATVLAVDLRGHGNSIQRGSETLNWNDFTNADWANLPGDVTAAIELVDGRKDLAPAALGLAGASIGSSGALLAAATDARVDTIVLLSPGLNYRDLLTEQAMIDYGARPALLVATSGDARSAGAVSQLISVNTDATDLVYTTGTGHGVHIADDHPELIDRFAEWFRDEM